MLPVLFEYSFSHGAMGGPKPRNNNPTNATVNYGIKFRKIDVGVAWDDFNVHDCTGGYQTAAEFTWDVCVRPAHTQHYRPAYMVSQSRPSIAHQIIDCTQHNDCSSQSVTVARPEDDQSLDFVWLAAYAGLDCKSAFSVIYKVRIDTCTQFPVTGKEYWTGGCEGYSCMWFSQGCSIGCPNCTGNTTDFFHNLCGSTKQPTIMDARFRTFNRYGQDPQGDWTKSNPWRAPGNAPVLDACGVAGGFGQNNEGPGGHPPPGHRWGDRGSELPKLEKTVWTAGSTVEVAWGIAANHGGGYQYRLCPASEPLTEECFQRMPLPFAGTMQTLLLGNGTSIEIAATFVSVGTTPEGSTWAMNPVPACGDAIPGTYGKPCKFPQFPPPPGCDGTCWGNSDETFRSGHRHAVLPAIVDRLKLPSLLAPGDYVLGWRWDCEQTPQVWSSCSDITIVAGEAIHV